MSKRPTSTNKKAESRYRAPALEKGLEILDLLSEQPEPLSAAEISARLNRSKSELFRMLQVLEEMDYIARSPTGDGFILTNRLFALGMRQPPTKSLLEHALPVMRELAERSGQSCHLAVQSAEQIVVIARIEAVEQVVFSVRVGYRQSLASTTSGILLFGFQSNETQQKWLDMLKRSEDKENLEKLIQMGAKFRRQGYGKARSEYVKGITDLSAPVIRDDHAIAALTVPHCERWPKSHSTDEVLSYVREAAEKISSFLIKNEG